MIAAVLFSGVIRAEPAPSSSAVKLDKAIQELKSETLQFNRDAATLERDTLYPPHSRVAIYLGVRINNLLMEEVSISIDNGAPQKIVYDVKQARALFRGSNIDRLFYANVPPGSHRIRADYTARFEGSKPDAKPVTGSYEAFFDKTYNASEFELVISKGKSSSKPVLTLKEWRRAK